VAYVLPEIVITHFLNRHFNVKPRTYTRKVKTKAAVQDRNSIVPATRATLRHRIENTNNDNTSDRRTSAIGLTRRKVPDQIIGATIDGLSDLPAASSTQAYGSQSQTIAEQPSGSNNSPQSEPFEQLPKITEPTLPPMGKPQAERGDSDSTTDTAVRARDTSIAADESEDMFKTDTEFAEAEETVSEKTTQTEPESEPAVYDLASLEQQMLDADDREEVVDKALAIASVYCQVAALFLVRQGTIQGLQGRGNALDSQPIDVILIPEHSESMLSRVVASTQSTRVVPETDIDIRLLRALGRDQVCEAAILPVVLKQRVVNPIYVDNGAYPIAQTTLSALETLTECVSSAYTNLIKRRKEEKAA
jgi:hypothetical protein